MVDEADLTQAEMDQAMELAKQFGGLRHYEMRGRSRLCFVPGRAECNAWMNDEADIRRAVRATLAYLAPEAVRERERAAKRQALTEQIEACTSALDGLPEMERTVRGKLDSARAELETMEAGRG